MLEIMFKLVVILFALLLVPVLCALLLITMPECVLACSCALLLLVHTM